MSDQFKHHDEDRIRLGELYRYTEEKYGSHVSVTFLDPRNLLAIAGYFMQHARRKHISIREAITNFSLHVKFDAIFINGRYLKNIEQYDHQIDYFVQG